MIGRDQIAEAARYADATLEELGNDLERWFKDRDLEPEGLFYVARQRALRGAMTFDGRDPRKLSRTDFETVALSRTARMLVPILTAAWLDGFGVRTILGERDAPGR